MKKYRIAWKSLITGLEGHGQWFDEKEKNLLMEHLARAQKHDHINHWIEEREKEVKK